MAIRAGLPALASGLILLAGCGGPAPHVYSFSGKSASGPCTPSHPGPACQVLPVGAYKVTYRLVNCDGQSLVLAPLHEPAGEHNEDVAVVSQTNGGSAEGKTRLTIPKPGFYAARLLSGAAAGASCSFAFSLGPPE